MGRGTVALLATSLAAGLITGCGASDGPPASRATSTASSAEHTADAAGRKGDDGTSPTAVLSEALEELASLDTGRFRHVITVRDSVSSAIEGDLENNPVTEVGIRFTGGYWLSTNSATVTGTAFDEKREQVKMRQRIDGRQVYMQVPAWPKPVQRCWVKLSDDFVDGLVSRTGTGGAPMPTAIAGLDDARAVDLMGEDLSATIPVGTALAAVAPALVGKAKGLDLEVRAPVTVHLSGGRVAGWEVWGRDLMDALDASGFPLKGSFRNLGHTSAKITLTAAGQSVTPHAPPRRLQMTQADFRRGQTCQT
jgi:hypothetical protein